MLAGLILCLVTFNIKTVYNRVICFPPGSSLLDYFEQQDQHKRGWPMKYYLEPVPADCEIPDTVDADIASHFYPVAFVVDLAIWSLVATCLFFIDRRSRRNK